MFTVKQLWKQVGFVEDIDVYCVLDNDKPVPGMTEVSHFSRAQAYADKRNNGLTHDQAIDYVLDHVRLAR